MVSEIRAHDIPIWPRPMKPHCACLPVDAEKALRCNCNADRTRGAAILEFGLIIVARWKLEWRDGGTKSGTMRRRLGLDFTTRVLVVPGSK